MYSDKIVSQLTSFSFRERTATHTIGTVMKHWATLHPRGGSIVVDVFFIIQHHSLEKRGIASAFSQSAMNHHQPTHLPLHCCVCEEMARIASCSCPPCLCFLLFSSYPTTSTTPFLTVRKYPVGGNLSCYSSVPWLR